jgi:C1A family cysteine protease
MFAKSLLVTAAAAVSDDTWDAWKQEYGIVYNGAEADAYRRGIFEENMVRAVEQQALNPEAEFGATQFSGLTPEEFEAQFLNYVPSVDDEALPEEDLSHLPLSVAAEKDWTGVATTPVKNQKSCGSCWAFSATEQIESDLILQHGVTEILGPQQLVDCTADGEGSKRGGCSGGNTKAAYKVIEANGGMERESDYPYTAKDGTCHISSSKFAAKVVSYTSVSKKDESGMKSYAGSTGPLSVCVAASTWHNYKSGVMTSCDTKTNHCVQLVGYGDSGSTSYWKVRNSWGTSFGEAGHLRIAIGSNLCNIANNPTKVTVEPLGQVNV